MLKMTNSFYRQAIHIGTILIITAIVMIGIAASFLKSLTLFRISYGSLIIMIFLRYRYLLLIVWVLINPLIGSQLPFFNGNHFLTILTVPTLVLMIFVPITQTLKRMPALVFLLIYLLWVIASIRISPLGAQTFFTLWTSYMDYVAVSVLAISVLTTRRRLVRLIDAIMLISTFISLYGIYDYFTRQHGIVDPTTSVFRSFSLFGSAPTLALFFSIVIPLAFYRALTVQSFKRIGILLLILLFLIALGLTFTRIAYVCIPLSIFIMILCLPSRKLKLALLSGGFALGFLIIILATLGHVPLLSRFFSKDIVTLNGRTYLWQAVLNHFDPRLVLGKGLGASDALLNKLQVRDSKGVIATVSHNLFLETLYDHGIIGLILLILVFIVLITNLITGIRKATGEHRMLFATALAISISVVLQSLESNDFWIREVGIYFWIITALPYALYWFAHEKPTKTQDADEITVDEEDRIYPATEPQFYSMQPTEQG